MNQQKFIALFILMTLAMLSCDLVTYRNDPNLEDNTSQYIVNFADHLDGGWRWKGTVHSREDIEGFSPSIVDVTTSSTVQNGHPNAFIAHYVIKLKDEAAAESRFIQIGEFIGSVLSPGYFDISSSVQESESDQQFVICGELVENNYLKDLHCQGVFQFSSYVVFLNIRAVVEGVEYLTEEEIIEVFNLAVDAMEQE